MHPTIHRAFKPIEYDAVRRRMWILGQRCHHGATGAVLASGATLGALIGAARVTRAAALIGAGGLLMVHDWKDRSIWFEPGHGTQP